MRSQNGAYRPYPVGEIVRGDHGTRYEENAATHAGKVRLDYNADTGCTYGDIKLKCLTCSLEDCKCTVLSAVRTTGRCGIIRE